MVLKLIYIVKSFESIIWKLLYKDTIVNNVIEAFQIYINSIPLDY